MQETTRLKKSEQRVAHIWFAAKPIGVGLPEYREAG